MDARTPSRREFLLSAAAVGAAGVLAGNARSNVPPVPHPQGKAAACVFINLVGGPSHVDTFDPKPHAPASERSPFRPIATRVPGLRLTELFPRMAALADRFSLVRGMRHTAPPLHEAGLQLLNAGRLTRDGTEWPGVGAVVSYLGGQKRGVVPAWCVVPHREIATGIEAGHGQGTGWLSAADCGALSLPPGEPPAAWSFALSCQLAAALIRAGHRFVTVNMYPTVFDALTWDCHADGASLPTTLKDYRTTVAPTFDAAFAELLTDLEEGGLLETTLVVATGEFGRTPWYNSNGGRDHWAGAWTAVTAGGGVQGGRVVGATDRRGAEVADRPATPGDLVATVYQTLGVPADATIPGPDGKPMAVYTGAPIAELF